MLPKGCTGLFISNDWVLSNVQPRLYQLNVLSCFPVGAFFFRLIGRNTITNRYGSKSSLFHGHEYKEINTRNIDFLDNQENT
jgi:hypothetical protein